MRSAAGTLALLVLVVNPAASSEAQDRAGGGIDPGSATEVFREFGRLCGEDDGELWGVSLCGPLLLVDPSTRAVAASEPDSEGLLVSEGGVYIGELPQGVPIANTALTWAGVHWAMILWPLPEDPFARGRLLVHESWHRIQERLGLPGSNPGNAHLDELDGRYLLRLEWRALARALEAEGADRQQAMRDALAFRAVRLERFPAARTEERQLMLHEGLAEYTGVVLAAPLLLAAEDGAPGAPAAAKDSDPAAAAAGGDEAAEACAAVSAAPAAAKAETASPATAAARARVAAALREAESGRAFARSFAYASGPAYGLLLDETDPAWHAGIGTETDLPDLLAAALGYADDDSAAATVEARAVAYGSDRMREEEVERDRARRERVATYRSAFVDGPVLLLRMSEPRISFHPHQVEPLGSEGSVYRELRAMDRWGALDAPDGALVSFESGTIRVPAPADPNARPLRGDGWTLELEEGWRLEPAERDGDFVLARRPPPS